MSDPSFEAKVRSAFRDLDLLRSGWRPGPEIEAVPLDGWYPVLHRALDLLALAGWADHPRLGQQLITRCLSRWYRLGESRSHFAHVPLTGWDDVEHLRDRLERTRG